VFPNAYYNEVIRRLRRTGAALRQTRVIRGLLLFSTIFLGALLVITILEALFHFPAWFRAFMLMVFVAIVGTSVVIFVFREILRQPVDEEVALQVEAVCPEANNALINCVRLGKDDIAQQRSMVGGFMFEAAETVRGVNFSAAVDRTPCLVYGLTTMLFALGLILFIGLSPLRFKNSLSRLLAPAADIPAMGSVLLEKVEPGDCALLAGSPLNVRATIKGGKGKKVKAALFYSFEGGQERAVPMSPAGENDFFCDINDVRMNMTYRVVIGGTESRRYSVTIVQKPAVKKIELTYRYPPYTGLEDKKTSDVEGAIEAVVGTRVSFRITATKKILRARLNFDGEEKSLPLQVNVLDPSILTGSITVEKDATYRIYLKDREGYETENPAPRAIKAIPDEAPDVTLAEPGGDVQVALRGSLPVVIRASDDFGVALVRLVMVKNQETVEREVARWDKFPDRKNVSIEYSWKFPETGYNDGDVVKYYVEATDNCEPSPHVTATEKFVIKVQDIKKKVEDRLEKYSGWEKRLQKILKKQREARQRAGEAFEP